MYYFLANLETLENPEKSRRRMASAALMVPARQSFSTASKLLRMIENLNVLDYEYYFKLTGFFLENKISDALLLLNDCLLYTSADGFLPGRNPNGVQHCSHPGTR